MTGCSINLVQPWHEPNDGRVIINNNFACLENAIENIQTTSATGSTIVNPGVNTTVVMSFSGTIPVYTVDVPSSAFTNSVSYTNTAATPTTIGGISAGSTFSGKTMQQMWDSLLYPYQYPAFTTFYINGQTSPLEVGATMIGTSRTFNWTTSNPSNVNTNSISITDLTTSTIIAFGLSNSGSYVATIPALTNTSPTTHSWGVSASNTQSGSLNDSYSVSWEWRVYYGTNISNVPSASLVTGLTSSFLSNSFAGTYSFAAGGYKIFSYPTSMGTATTFKDTSTNLNVAMQPPVTISITNTYGVTTNYNVHVTTNSLGGSINIQIS